MTRQSKPAVLPRKGGSFIRESNGKLTQTEGPAVNKAVKADKPAKATKEES